VLLWQYFYLEQHRRSKLGNTLIFQYGETWALFLFGL